MTFECDHPAEARTRRSCRRRAIPEGLPPREIDAFVSRARCGAARTSTTSTTGALAGLDADLVVTQDLCAVCAVDVSVVDDALAHLGCRAEVLTIDPHTLDEVLASVVTLGAATGHDGRGGALVAGAARAAGRRRRRRRRPAAPAGAGPRVDRPAVRARHWVPEMVAAGRRLQRARRRRARSPFGPRGTRCRAASRRSSSARPAATTSREPASWPQELIDDGVLPARHTGLGGGRERVASPVPAPGSSTASRRWPASSTRTRRQPPRADHGAAAALRPRRGRPRLSRPGSRAGRRGSARPTGLPSSTTMTASRVLSSCRGRRRPARRHRRAGSAGSMCFSTESARCALPVNSAPAGPAR